MFRNILVICTANICRSPMAEGLLKLRLQNSPDIVVHSAGTTALVGSGPHPNVVNLLRREGIDLVRHRARQCDLEMLREADLVLVMERNHLKWLSSRFPQFHGRTYLMGHWQHKADVPDPIGQPRAAFEETLDLLKGYADDWVSRIVKG